MKEYSKSIIAPAHPAVTDGLFCFVDSLMIARLRLLPGFFLTVFFIVSPARTQEQSALNFEIQSVHLIGNQSFDQDDLETITLTRETPGVFSKFFYSIFGEKLGRRAQFYEAEVLRSDLERIRLFYQDNGYFDTAVWDSLVFDTTHARVDISILIKENRVSRLDTISYVGLSQVSQELHASIFEEPIIQRGTPYIKEKIKFEIDRVLRILGNEGYPNAQFDRERSVAQRFLSTGNFSLSLVFHTGQRLRFGDVSVVFNPSRDDLTENIVLHQLEFKPGDIYSREKIIESERNLNRLGVFETASVIALPSPKGDSSGVVAAEITARPRDRNELSPEISVSDENNAFNLGVGIGYTNRNFFGDARNFTTRSRLRAQSIQEWNFGNVFGREGLRDPSVLGAAEIQFHLLQPYLFSRSLSGTWIFSLSAEKQAFYILPIVRNKIGLSNQFARYTVGFFEWTLERVSVEFLKDTTLDLNRQREEERPQFNSIFTATLQRDKTNDIFSPTEGFFHSITLEESGILPKLLKSLQPNLPFTQFYKVNLLGKWYQDLTRTRYNIFALKLRAGYQDKYGESKQDSSIRIPLNRRFFAGGSGSIRGWRSRDLGAMPDNEIPFGGNFIFEGSTEMRINYFRGFGKLWFVSLDNLWVVYFLDFGSVWSDLNTFQARDIAIAAGFGIRYETLFGPFRIDFGFRVYDPRENAGRQWVFQKKFFGDILGNGILHFGIGHAF